MALGAGELVTAIWLFCAINKRNLVKKHRATRKKGQSQLKRGLSLSFRKNREKKGQHGGRETAKQWAFAGFGCAERQTLAIFGL